MLSRRTLAVAVTLAGVAACSNDTISNPTLRSPSAPSRDASSANTPFHRNTEKYSDAGAHPATGRSGSSSLQARALLGKDGKTVVEATTGDLEAGTQPGQLSKMQVKFFTLDDSLSYARNYNGLTGSGYWTDTYSGFARDEKVQVQGNVRGIDPKRTDVVTDTTLIKLRPDLAVGAVQAPARAYQNTVINVSALVSELNHDVGAHAQCVLSVDGVAADQAQGIWVDAGDAVTCAFQTSIADTGKHQLTVSANDVRPGDWDTANNTASTTIEIVPPETPLNYYTNVWQNDYDYQSNYSYSYWYGSTEGRNETGHQNHWGWGFHGWTNAATATFPVTLHAKLSSGASTAVDVSATFGAASWYYGSCSYMWVEGINASVCSGQWYGNRTQVNVSANGGHVTYFGNAFNNYYGWYGYGYNYPISADYSLGAGPATFASSADAVVEVTDANGMKFAARPTIALSTRPINDQWNYCYNDWYWYGGTYCYNGYNRGTETNGFAADYSHQ